MTDRSRRFVAVAVTVVVVIVIAVAVTWRATAMNRGGWAGLTYEQNFPQKTPLPGFVVPGAVTMIYPDSPAQAAHLVEGDRILAVNGICSCEPKKVAALERGLHRGDVITYTIEHDGRTLRVPVRLATPTGSIAYMVSIVSSLLPAGAFLLVGLFVFQRKPNDERAVVFFAMAVAAATYFGGSAVLYYDMARGIQSSQEQLDLRTLLPLLFLCFTTAVFVPLLLHLALIFPRRRPVLGNQPTLLRWIYTFPLYVAGMFALAMTFAAIAQSNLPEAGIMRSIPIALGVLALVSIAILLLRGRAEGFRKALIRRPLNTCNAAAALVIATMIGLAALARHLGASTMAVFAGTLILSLVLLVPSFALYPISTIVALYRGYAESNAEEKRQAKWPLWGTIVAVSGRFACGAIGITFGMSALINVHWRWASVLPLIDAVPKLLYVLIPVSFGFAILKYRLMNIDVIIRKTVLYSILSVTIFVLYVTLTIGLGTTLVHLAGVQNQTTVIVSTIAVALLVVPLRNKLQQMVDRNLFRTRRDYPQVLRTVTNEIGRGRDLHSFLQFCTEQIREGLQNRFIVMLLRRENEYVATAKVGVADEVVGNFRLPATPELDEALGQWFDPRKRPLTADVAGPLRRRDVGLVVPVSAHRRPLGLLAAGTKLSDQEFDLDDLDFLTSAASQIALGIENARLRTEQVEFEQARAMQQLLLPRQFPRIDGIHISGTWQPARSVGGDYFDALQLDPTRAGVCIGDVAGKGMPAALLMATLQAAVKATAASDVSPSELCARVQRVVAGNLSGKFITFFYAVVDGASRTLTFCNAGHNPPMVVRASGAIERLAAGGPVFARLFRDDRYENGRIALEPGDRVVLFTDGASEAARNGEQFGEERLADVIAANRHLDCEGLQNAILDAVTAFSGGDFDDDVTLVVISA